MKIKDKLKLLSILAYVVECNGSQEVLDAIDNDIDYLHTRKNGRVIYCENLNC